MNHTIKNVGIDGCRLGWVGACYDTQQVYAAKEFSDIIRYFGDDSLYMVDIPMGLAEIENERSCEAEARRLLPSRYKSSVFAVPCRQAIGLNDYKKACKKNKEILKKSMSQQTFHIMHKIRAVDDYLQTTTAKVNIKESHPEIAFYFLNGQKPLEHKKKTKDGIEERLEILTKLDSRTRVLNQKALDCYKRKCVKRDDIIDALCLALLPASQHGVLKTVPSEPQKDKMGIEMAIYYSEKTNQ